MWNVLGELLSHVEIPCMFPAKQEFSVKYVTDWKAALQEELAKVTEGAVIKRGMRIAITAGSRGINNIPCYLRFVGDYLRALGANPFVVAAMGSHGGATAAGQANILAELGITDETVGMPIVSSMETVLVGFTPAGLPAYLDKAAFEADGIILINRIKAHTQFRGPYESGLVKMLVIGLGKQMGADCCHRQGMSHMSENIASTGRYLLEKAPVLFGIGLIENAYDQTAEIVGVRAEELLEREPELLQRAKRNMPCIKIPNLDVLIVDKIGKNYSGSGMDPNVTGRFYSTLIPTVPAAERIAVLGLSAETGGNACGLGVADVTTRRVVESLDRESVYINGLTSCVSESGRIPLYFDSDREAIQAAIKLTGKTDCHTLRMARIANTMELGRIDLSEALLSETATHRDMAVLAPPEQMEFDFEGNLQPM